jgi:hypothetical protein
VQICTLQHETQPVIWPVVGPAIILYPNVPHAAWDPCLHATNQRAAIGSAAASSSGNAFLDFELNSENRIRRGAGDQLDELDTTTGTGSSSSPRYRNSVRPSHGLHATTIIAHWAGWKGMPALWENTALMGCRPFLPEILYIFRKFFLHHLSEDFFFITFQCLKFMQSTTTVRSTSKP